MRRRALREEPLVFERNPDRHHRQGVLLPRIDVPEVDPAAVLPSDMVRSDGPIWPDLGELEVVQHFHRLSQLNYAVDEGLYPLGSCTMKYNPRVNERTARLEGFADLHPLQPAEQIQGALQLMWELEEALKAITGMAGVTLQPAAGAHGELAGILMIRKALEAAANSARWCWCRTRRTAPTRPLRASPATARSSCRRPRTAPSTSPPSTG